MYQASVYYKGSVPACFGVSISCFVWDGKFFVMRLVMRSLGWLVVEMVEISKRVVVLIGHSCLGVPSSEHS